MPNKYEREIDEILRNLERQAPKTTFGQRMGSSWQQFARRFSQPRPINRNSLRSRRTLIYGTEWLFWVTILLAILAGVVESASNGPNIITGVLAILALLFLICAIYVPWAARRRSRPLWRGHSGEGRSRSPFAFIRRQWKLLRLRFRYRQNRGK